MYRLLAKIRRTQYHVYLAPMYGSHDAYAEPGRKLCGVLHWHIEFNEQIDIAATGGVIQP